jgi:hypothetical protein
MAGQAAHCSRESVRACIKGVEKNNSGGKPQPLPMKTTSKQ